MPVKRKNKNHRYALFASILFFVAGIGGYVASGYYHSSDHNKNTVAEQETPKPDPLACIAALPVNTKLSQKVMLAVYSDQIDQISPILGKLGIGGVIIMDEVSPEQIAKLRSAFKIAPIIAIDQEGGTVQRYKSEGTLPGATDMAKLTPDQAYELYLKDSKYLAGIGITTNLAPVVDVESRRISPLPGRIYSSDASVVASYASKAIKAMQDAKIQPVIKHFPGMGSASANTDFASASTTPLAALQNRDLTPYRELAAARPDVMVGNMIVPDLTNGQPAIWSPEAIALLRELGYEISVIYSDSLTAKAVPGTLQDAALKSWKAGVDITLIVQEKKEVGNLEKYVTSITSLGSSQLDSGSLDQASLNKSVERILARKNINPCDIATTQ